MGPRAWQHILLPWAGAKKYKFDPVVSFCHIYILPSLLLAAAWVFLLILLHSCIKHVAYVLANLAALFTRCQQCLCCCHFTCNSNSQHARVAQQGGMAPRCNCLPKPLQYPVAAVPGAWVENFTPGLVRGLEVTALHRHPPCCRQLAHQWSAL